MENTITSIKNDKSLFTKLKEALFTPKFSLRNVFLSLCLGFLVAYLSMLIIYGANDANSIVTSLFRGDFSSSTSIARLLDKIVILGFAGLSVAFGMKAGLLNIGVSGQMTFGAFVAFLVVRKLEITNIYSILTIGFIITVIASTLIALISGILKSFFKVNEVISTIMMNWIVVYLIKFFASSVSSVGTSSVANFGGNQTKDIISLDGDWGANDRSTNIPLLQNGDLWNTWYLAIVGIVLFVLTSIILWFIFSQTRYGFKLISIGKSKEASHYAGYNEKLHTIIGFGISGFLAGMAGFTMFFLASNIIPAGLSPINEGFFGIAVALVGMNNPLGIVGSAIIMGILNGPTDGIILWGLPGNLIDIFTGIITYFVAISSMWMYLRPIQAYKNFKFKKAMSNTIQGGAI